MLWFGLIITLFIIITFQRKIETVSGGNDLNNFVVLPTQLFYNTDSVKYKNIYIVEDPVYFTRFKFHKLALVMRRASMRAYEDYLRGKTKANIIYIEFPHVDKFYNETTFTMYHPADRFIEKKISKTTTMLPSPYFLNNKKDLHDFIKGGGKFRHDSNFYPWMRKRYNILVKGDKPIGGRWSFDNENRNPFPQSMSEPKISSYSNKYVDEAREYIRKHFGDNYGDYGAMHYPHTHTQAKARLRDFIDNKLKLFGKYQDAASKSITFGFHSVLSSSLNCGLLTPREVIDAAVTAYRERKAPLASVEGFIRQILGWREYCWLCYYINGEKMRNSNYFGHKRKLTQSWYNGDTGLQPIDDIIARIHVTGYAHHIERLMWLSAVMLMCGVAPDAVYEWFITFVAIDAYDWVMTPNIYGMGTYADGGSSDSMMTRPYFSSFAYVERMSDWGDPKDAEVWNALYYNFIGENKAKLKSNYYTARWVGNYDRKSASEKKEIKEIARKFIAANTMG